MVQLLATVLEQRAPSPRKLRPEISQGLAKVVLRCLEKQPGERFKNYADLARALGPYSSAAPTPGTLGLRFLAGVVDMTLLGLLAGSINLLAFGGLMAFMEQAMQLSPKVLVWALGWICVVTLYYGLFEGLWGAAVGKAICRLRVVGEDRNPPGVARAFFRNLIFALPPAVPYWLAYGSNTKAYLSASQLSQTLLVLSCYVIMGLLFCTVRHSSASVMKPVVSAHQAAHPIATRPIKSHARFAFG